MNLIEKYNNITGERTMFLEETVFPKILVVDDRRENLVAMQRTLDKIDADVICVDNGNEALKQILRQEFAVVLMDVQMPEMNGFETAELIRSNIETSSLPIIFITAINKEKQYVKKGYEIGAVDYIFKPFDPYILRYKVSVFIDLFCQRNKFLTLAKKNQLILDSVREGVFGTDSFGRIIFSNPAAARLVQDDRYSVQGQSINRFINGYENQTWEKSDIYQACDNNGHYCRSDLEFKTINGKPFSVECTATAMYDIQDCIVGFVVIFNDISARLKAEKQLAQLAEHDPLTGLANRRLFYQILPKILARATRLGNKVALLFIDIDHFKSINDTLGHCIGDLLLTQVAQRLEHCVRESDTVVRLSGDEFTIIVENQINNTGIIKIADNIIKQMAFPFVLDNNQIHCSLSIGIATTPDVPAETNQLIKAADIAMYNAKKQGRNNYQFYDESLDKIVTTRAQVETQLQKKPVGDEFFLHYQPKVDIATGKLKGMESLLRWNSPILGSVSPEYFIPIAEDCGCIQEIGDWVLSKSINQLKLWAQQVKVSSDFSLSINCSIKQLNSTHFLTQLEQCLKETNINPANLDIEITETTLMTDPNAIIPLLRVINEMGLTISVDDFGTGYSSLSYLKLLPIHILKIDKSFILDLFQDTNSEIITHSIINLAHNLGLRVVAEGIETKEQLDFLKHHGCDLGQGYFFSKPLSSHDVKDCFHWHNQ